MDSIHIKSLKSIEDSGELKTRLITIFVGRNNSGKSSLLRSLPLFKQSTESKTLGTVLWSGKYVDYGSFIEAVNSKEYKNDPSQEISFSFSFKMHLPQRRELVKKITAIKLSVRVHGDEYSKASYSIFEYEINGNLILLKYDSSQKLLLVEINGVDFTKSVVEYFISYKSYSIIPLLYDRSDAARGKEPITANLVKELRSHVHHRTSDRTLTMAARILKFDDDDEIMRLLQNKAVLGESAARNISEWEKGNIYFSQIKNQIIFCDLRRIIDSVNDYMLSYFYSLRYITPLRAAADRYYRIQNTSIEELDPNGSNLAMFLHAKSESDIEKLNAWLREEIGFSIEMATTQGHASIFITDKFGNRSNIADTGFGFSQILPILVQMWQSSNGRIRKYPRTPAPATIVIEQPELHLHPHMQSQVGSMFCKSVASAKRNSIDLRVIMETHSRDIVESVGKCIELGILAKEDVSVYIVDKNSSLNVIESGFDDGGYLVSWPYGFFDGA